MRDLLKPIIITCIYSWELLRGYGRRVFIAFISLSGLSILIPWLDSLSELKCKEIEHTNVVVIMADDLGWGEIGCHGSPTKTPNIDKFFQEGMELRSHMVYPVCSPTRAAFLTGRNAISVGITPSVVNPDIGTSLKGEEVTLAEVFSSAGYTTAIVGKWHLGYSPSPNEQGFDEWFGFYGGALDYFTRIRNRMYYDWFQNDSLLQIEGYNTELIGERAVKFINDNANRPFFLYVAFTAPHNPLQAEAEDLVRTPERMEPIYYQCSEMERKIHSAMNISMDDEVGKIITTLKKKNIENNTIVLFMSDNGATSSGNSRPFRGRKHSVYEGGIRTPAAIRWPGHIKAGSITDELIGVEDWFPTLLRMTGIEPPRDLSLDGVNVGDVLTAGASSPREFYSWIWFDYDVMRTKRWKLFRWFDKKELYDLSSDPYEQNNLITKKPKVAERLEELLIKWQNSVGCYPSHIPVDMNKKHTPNPDGNVIEITARSDGGDELRNLIAYLGESKLFQITPGDWLEYDLMIAPESESQGFYLDISRGVIPEPVIKTIPFRNIRADMEAKRILSHDIPYLIQTYQTNLMFSNTYKIIDQFGVPQNLKANFTNCSGQWSRRVIGLGTLSPQTMNEVALLIDGKRRGKYHIYLDNILVHRRGGETVELYRDGRINEIRESFGDGKQDIMIRSIPVEQCKQ